MLRIKRVLLILLSTLTVACSPTPAKWTNKVEKLSCGMSPDEIGEALSKEINERRVKSENRGSHRTFSDWTGSYVSFWIEETGLQSYQVVKEYQLDKTKAYPLVNLCN